MVTLRLWEEGVGEETKEFATKEAAFEFVRKEYDGLGNADDIITCLELNRFWSSLSSIETISMG